MESGNPETRKSPQKPRFWVGPLVVGCCFSLGYGVTDRVLTLHGNAEEPRPEAFEQVLFPGDSLSGLRQRAGTATNLLQVDLDEIESSQQEQRKLELEAQKRADNARRAQEALQAVVLPPEQPAWTEPTLPPPPPDSQAEPVVEAGVESVPEPDAQPVPQPVPQLVQPVSNDLPQADSSVLIEAADPLPAGQPGPVIDTAVFEPVAPPPPMVEP